MIIVVVNQANTTFKEEKKLQSEVESIAVSLCTNSETAVATPLRVMLNFQRTLLEITKQTVS